MVVTWRADDFKSHFSAPVKFVCLGVVITPVVVVGRLLDEVLGVAGVAGEEVESTGLCDCRVRPWSWDDRRCQDMERGRVPSDLPPEDSALGDFEAISGGFGPYPATYDPVVTENAVVRGTPDRNLGSSSGCPPSPLVAGRRVRAGFRGGIGGPADDADDGLQFGGVPLVFTVAKKVLSNGEVVSEVEVGHDVLP